MRSFFLSLVLTIAGALTLIVGFLCVVDASGLLHTRLIPTALMSPLFRTDVGGADRAVKALEISGQPSLRDALFLGSSRTQFAFDPKIFPEFSSYNAGMRGARMTEHADILNYVFERGPKVDRVIWATDFWEFFDDGSAFAPEVSAAFTRPQPMKTWGRLLLSYDMVRRSMNALVQALSGRLKPVFETNGFYIVENAQVYAAPDFPAMPNLRNWFDPSLMRQRQKFRVNLERGLTAFQTAVQAAKARGVVLDVVLLPEHVARLALYRQIGLWEDYEYWKSRLADALAQAEAAPGEGAVRITDFNLLNQVSLSAFPPERFGNPYFFEVMHVRPRVARMVVARLLNWPEADLSFGRPLDQSLSADALGRQRALLNQWALEHPQEMADIESILAKFR